MKKSVRISERSSASRNSPASLRQAILDTARELFDSEGYDKLSMRRVGREVGCSAMAMYRHFESKEDLLVSICEETFAEVSKRRAKYLNPQIAPVERLRSTMRASIEFGTQFPSRYKLVFMTDLPGSSLAERKLAIIDTSFDLYRQLVQDCVQKNGSEVDVEVTVHVLRAGVNGVISGIITNTLGRNQKVHKRMNEQLIETLTRDLG